MIRVGVAGAAGRMGQTIIEVSKDFAKLECTQVFEYDQHPSIDSQIKVNQSSLKIVKSSQVDYGLCDVVIDFTTPQSTLQNLRNSQGHKTAFVIGTTGFSNAELNQIKDSSKERPILLAPNMSLGANLIFALAKKAASILGDQYNPEVIEAHHRHKKDAPSGTAKRLGEAIAEGLDWNYEEVARYGRSGITGERPVKEIGMHVIRGGEIVGDHVALFAGAGENIEIRHTAFSREAFARGALKAAGFVTEQTCGFYDMFDVLGLEL